MLLPVRVLVAAVIGIGVLSSAASATEAPPNPAALHTSGFAAASGVDAANAYVYRDFTAAGTHPYVEHRAQLSVEQEQNTIGYFYPDQFAFDGGGTGTGQGSGYMGVQTHTWTDHDIGKGVIVSIWGAQTVDTSNCASRGCVGVSGVEGTPFLSIRMPFTYIGGWSYEVRLARGHTGDVLNQRVDATIVDLTHNIVYPVGALGVPANWGGFTNHTVQWTEEYSPNTYPACSSILRTSVLWSGVTTMLASTGGLLGPSASTPTIQSGPGICTNSNSYYLGEGIYREVIGALS